MDDGTRFGAEEAVPEHAGDAQPLVKLVNVHKSFGETEVLKGIDLEIQRGEVLVIVGPSGGGKSTLLRCLNALEDIQSGQITFDGKDLTDWDQRELRQQVGMVFQHFNLFPHLTALQNLTLGPRKVLKVSKEQAIEEAKQLLRKVELSDKWDSYPHQLSGGQQQRVAIARALMMSPKMVLFDEVTSALDPELVGEVLKVMAQLSRDGMTMGVVTHEMTFAREAGDVMAFISGGKIVEIGTPEAVLDRPANVRTQQFLQRT